MATKAKIKALAYVRVSSKGQAGADRGGFPRQRAAIDRYAKAHGLAVAETFQDSITGKTELDDRPGLAALLDRIESNGVQVVLIERADRLARDLLVSEVILGQFRDAGVTVVAADSGTDLSAGDDDPTRVLIRQVLGAVSQFEKSVIVRKLKAARDRKRRRDGWCEGRKPFGHRAGEAETLERIKALHRKPRGRPRMSYAKIAAALNDEHRPTRAGGPWRPGSVFDIVKRVMG